MARFDVFKTREGACVLDCQADVLAYLHTRIVAPLFPSELEPRVSERLNPGFDIDGEHYVLYPQFIAAVSTKELSSVVASLSHENARILAALDLLISGF